MTQKQRVAKKIRLSFELTRYLIDNPKVTDKYRPENYVIYTETPSEMNRDSDKTLQEITSKGKSAVKAMKKSGIKNSWRFEIATP